MTDNEEVKLKQRGRMAYLHDDIARLSRERDTLLRPLRDRINRALPRDEPAADAARQLDCSLAGLELASVAPVNAQLETAILEHNDLAVKLNLPLVSRPNY